MKFTRSTIITGMAVLVLVAAIPSAIREALESGRIYLFSSPGRFTRARPC